MKLEVFEQEILNNIIQEFIEEFPEGREILKKIYKMHRRIANELGITHFPIPQIYRDILMAEIFLPQEEGGHLGKSLNEIAKEEDIAKSTLYNIYHSAMDKKKTSNS